MACDNGDRTTLLRSTTIQLSLHFIYQLLVIPDPSIFLPEDSEINMPIVSVNIRDTAAPNNTKNNSVSFVTTLSNVNNDPPKEDIIYCDNTTELFTINFGYQVWSKDSALRFDLLYPTMNIFFKISLRSVTNNLCIHTFQAQISYHSYQGHDAFGYRQSKFTIVVRPSFQKCCNATNLDWLQSDKYWIRMMK